MPKELLLFIRAAAVQISARFSDIDKATFYPIIFLCIYFILCIPMWTKIAAEALVQDEAGVSQDLLLKITRPQPASVEPRRTGCLKKPKKVSPSSECGNLPQNNLKVVSNFCWNVYCWHIKVTCFFFFTNLLKRNKKSSANIKKYSI